MSGTRLLAALVHFRIGEVLQPLLSSEETGLVALSCHFACDALCAELYDWDEAEHGRPRGNRRCCRPPATRGAKATAERL